jgi:L-alanine-DL-glutamate epimerase-like enolase superfamily enzyme
MSMIAISAPPVCFRLEPARVGLESPLPANLIRGYQSLKRQGALPILMDEGIVSPVEVAEFIALEMFDGVAMKVARCAGLWNASRIVSLLRENNLLMFASGLTDPDLSLAASAHWLNGHERRFRGPPDEGTGCDFQARCRWGRSWH